MNPVILLAPLAIVPFMLAFFFKNVGINMATLNQPWFMGLSLLISLCCGMGIQMALWSRSEKQKALAAAVAGDTADIMPAKRDTAFILEKRNPQMKDLRLASVNQQRFADMLNTYPTIARYWDFETLTVDRDALLEAVKGMELKERQLALFFLQLWDWKNDGFNMVAAAMAWDREARLLVSDWLRDPFWPWE